jgi:hypothetical protein
MMVLRAVKRAGGHRFYTQPAVRATLVPNEVALENAPVRIHHLLRLGSYRGIEIIRAADFVTLLRS